MPLEQMNQVMAGLVLKPIAALAGPAMEAARARAVVVLDSRAMAPEPLMVEVALRFRTPMAPLVGLAIALAAPELGVLAAVVVTATLMAAVVVAIPAAMATETATLEAAVVPTMMVATKPIPRIRTVAMVL